MTRPVSPSLRAKIENAVERLLAVLDHLDGDPDLEDDAPLEDGGDREPSLCGLSIGPGDHWDREGPDDNGIGDHGDLQEQEVRALWGDAPAGTEGRP